MTITIIRKFRVILSLCALLGGFAAPVFADDLTGNFAHPPASARPWVYWFWNNGNVTSNGVTADLEAMQRVGIGGVLIMDVAVERYGAAEHCGPPRGTAEFMNPEWQNLFQFSVQEAAKLGLEINLNDGPGWTGSSGPWITPELAMQNTASARSDLIAISWSCQRRRNRLALLPALGRCAASSGEA